MGAENNVDRGRSSKIAAFWIAAIAFGAGTVLTLMLFGNISTRKREAESTVLRIVDITETTVDPAEWGKNFPRQYDGYIRTDEQRGTAPVPGGSEELVRPRMKLPPIPTPRPSQSWWAIPCSRRSSMAMRLLLITGSGAGTRLCCWTSRTPSG